MTTCFYMYGSRDQRHTPEGLASLPKSSDKTEVTPATIDGEGFVTRVFVHFRGSMDIALRSALTALGYEFRRPYDYEDLKSG